MDARPLAALGETPLETRMPALEIQLPHGDYSLSTGDNFVTAPPEISSDAVDMEAYAIAKVCALEGVPFSCFKFITDLADENAAELWQENVSLGAQAFMELVSD
jgi:adenosylhomocysteine nucleosidase